MIRYKCPECGASCHTAHCYDCDRDIPMSQRYDDEVESEPSAEYSPAMPNRSAREKPVYSRYAGYKCPTCGATCKTSHCFDCDKDLPMSTRISDDDIASPRISFASSMSHTASYDVKVGIYFSVDNYGHRFKIHGDRSAYSFSELVNYELYEGDTIVAKGGIGRAVVGGALFGDVGAIVGATTRKTESKVSSLYIRLTLKSVGMRKIVLISSPTSKNGIIYMTARKSADEIMSQLDLISAKNRTEAENKHSEVKETENEIIQPPQPPTSAQPSLIADELLKLKQLLDMGVLTDEEFQQQKQKLLNR